jgi:Holliday junction resolvasome RuvABC endonuclease subunit
MNFLFVDPALSCGWCLVSIGENKAVIFAEGVLDVDDSSQYQGDWCLDLMEKVSAIMDENDVKEVGTEDYMFSKRFAKGCSVNVHLRASIFILSRQRKLPYHIIGISTWKKHIAGRCTPTREQKAKWKKKAKKYFIQDALDRKYGFRFPNHSISSKTGKPIAFRSDVVDAVAMAVYYCEDKLGLKVERTTPIPQDVVFKNKNVFQYED